MKARILLTCVGGTMMPDLLTHLRNDPVLKLYLVGVDAMPNALGRACVDAFYQVPWGEDSTYVDEVARIVAAEKVDLVLPGSDPEAFSLASGRDKIAAAGALVLASPVAVLDLIRDKQATYCALQAAGLRVPEYTCVSNVDDLLSAISGFGYPGNSVIIKPVAGRGGRGMRVLLGTDEAPAAWIGGGAREKRVPSLVTLPEMGKWLEDGTLMVMPLLHAPVHDVDVFAVKGRVHALIVRRRNNPAGIPFTGNLIVSDPAVVAYCREIAECLGLDALHDMDLMTDGDGQPCLLEVNPRPSGSVAAAHAAGYPVVAAAIAETLGLSYSLTTPIQDIEVVVMSRAIAIPKA